MPNPEESFPDPPFKKMVFMVIDAFRSDFAFSVDSSMPFVHSSIRNQTAIGFTAFSTPPTVTLPRIKGLTTGSTPNFLDAILNIAEGDTSSTLAGQDSWVAQIISRGRKINMFGDDTWIKLFPNMFNETDGTASFFVADFTEVDNNVTRHLDIQLSPFTAKSPEEVEADWDVLILHYLGLDHIGHKGGPNSVFMPGKQREMNDIIEKIYNTVSSDTLLVVVGDHGMNEAGNHGGSSSGETSAAAIMFSEKFKSISSDVLVSTDAPLPSNPDYSFYRKISQSDLVPTFASLLDFPIPINSLGVVLKETLDLWPSVSDKWNVLTQNIHQITNILDKSYPGFMNLSVDDEMFCESQIDFDDIAEIEKLKCMWWSIQQVSKEHQSTFAFKDYKSIEDLAFDYLGRVQNLLSKDSSNYKVDLMKLGLVFVAISFVVTLFVSWSLLKSSPLTWIILLGIAGLYSASMFGSSLVEEEHHFWYWGVTGWISWLYILTARYKFTDGFDWVISLVIVRVIRSWNQTGQKYAGSPDIASFLSLPENSGWLWFLIVVYYGSVFERLWKGTFLRVNGFTGFILSFATTVSSIFFKINMACQSGESVPAVLKMLVAYDEQVLEEDPSKLVSFARLGMIIIMLGLLYELSDVILSDGLSEYYLNKDSDSQETIKISKSITNMSTFIELFLVMQSKPKNIPLFIFFNMLRTFLVKTTSRSFIRFTQKRNKTQKGKKNESSEVGIVRVIATLSITILFMQHVSFFAMGNSNSLASIDLSNAYNGLSNYNIVAVGLLTFIGNWAGPLYWSITAISILLEDKVRPELMKSYAEYFSSIVSQEKNAASKNDTKHAKEKKHKNKNGSAKKQQEALAAPTQPRKENPTVGFTSICPQGVITLRIIINQVFFSAELAGILGACIVLKDHLFIWTVFSPKLLYAVAWVVIQHAIIDIGICTFMSLLRV